MALIRIPCNSNQQKGSFECKGARIYILSHEKRISRKQNAT